MDIYNIKVNGISYEVEVEKVEAVSVSSAGKEVKTKTKGKVWKVAAEKGSEIAKGDTIMIMEAMKMEIPIVAPEAGTVNQLLVIEGDSLEAGQTVAVIG